MNIKIYLLSVILLFTFHTYTNPSPQKELLKNLSLFYAGSWLSLKVVANIAADLSGATPVYEGGKTSRRFVRWEYQDGTDSAMKNNLLWLANSSFNASQLAITPLFSAAMIVPAALFDFILLITSGVYDVKRFFASSKIEEGPSLDEEQFPALKTIMKETPQVFLSLIAGFGVPLILQILYQKLQK